MNKEDIRKFEEWEKKLGAYEFALSLISIDANDRPPANGAAMRNERTAILSGEAFEIRNDPAIFQLITDMKDDPELDETIRRKASLYWRELSRTKNVPKQAYLEYETILHESEQAWLKYKNSSDWQAYAPYLERLVKKQKEILSYRTKTKNLYDTLLDDHEPGWDTERYDAFFARVRERLVPLIKEVSSLEETDDSFLHAAYPVEEQRLIMEEINAYTGFDISWGKMGESEHPLTTWLSENDVRITTKYREYDAVAGILSTVHETGHAYYAHQVDSAYDGTIIANSISAGMHESQSRLCENHLGRSDAFWRVNFPKMQKHFPDQLSDISFERFMKAVNKVKPSLIRTEADELTYPLHIMIRYEIEKMLFDGDVSVAELEDVWNQKYKEYLGVEVPSAKMGILQDMHWPYAYFGYFPTYALGSAFAAQFFHKMEQEIPVSDYLEKCEFAKIMDWLKEHIHRYGNMYPSSEIMKLATGEDFNADYYLDYLENKYRKLYGLK